MKHRNTLLQFALAGAAFSALLPDAEAQTAWLPEPGRVLVSPVFTTQSFRQIWAGSRRMTLGEDVTQRSAAVALELGLTDRVAADAIIGFSATNSAAFGGPESDRGLADSSFGLRWQLLNEMKDGEGHRYPTLAARFGGTIGGTYRSNLPFSSGDGASGTEFSLLANKQGGRGFGTQSEIGYRWRSGNVPSEMFGSAGLHQSVGRVTFSGGYRFVKSTSGSDIGDPGFQFRSLREIDHVANGGIGLSHGDRYYQFFVAKSLDGRNTGGKVVLGGSITISLKLPTRSSQ